MAVTFKTPEFSFVQLSEPSISCAWSERPCLPVYDLQDLRFRVNAEVTGDDKGTFDTDAYGVGITLDCDSPGILTANYVGTWVKIETGDGDNPDLWVGVMKYDDAGLFPLYDTGQCFSLMIFKTSDGTPIECFETCFKKIDDKCAPQPTTVIEYYNDENAFYFNYADLTTSGNANRVRLELYFHSPTDAIEQKSYAKSDGSTKMIMQRIWKDYRVKTNYFPDEWHERLVVATAHDNVLITCDLANLNQDLFVRTEKIDLEWKQEDTPYYQLAQGKTTMRLAIPRSNVNSNCQ